MYGKVTMNCLEFWQVNTLKSTVAACTVAACTVAACTVAAYDEIVMNRL